MKPLLQFLAFCGAALLGACATPDGGPTSAGSATAAVGSSRPTTPAALPPVSSSATGGQPLPSLKETARLQNELGNQVIPYPFDTCAVIQRPFGNKGPKHRRIYQGHEVLFCCTPCVRAFDTNPEPYMPRIIAAAKEKAAGTVIPPVIGNR